MLFRFEDFALDTDRRELRRADALVPLEPSVFDLVAYLVRHRDRVVSQDDLFAGVWEGRVVSESTLRSRINAARAAIGDSGDEQRLIKTLPRKGFRFVGSVREEAEPAAAPAPAHVLAPADTHRELIARPADSVADLLPPPARSPAPARHRPALLLAIGAGLGIAATSVAFLLWQNFQPAKIGASPRVLQKFDAAAVPLVADVVRAGLANYPARRDAKAVAIALDGWGAAEGAPDLQAAEREALRLCGVRTKWPCRTYALGMDVVYMPPLAARADLRVEPLSIPLAVEDIPTINLEMRRLIADRYLPGPKHKALALTSGGTFQSRERQTRPEAIRLALESCGENYQRPCLLLSVDGFLTMQIPKSRKIVGIFLPSVEAAMTDADKARIGAIYKEADWRALARGKAGWHAVAAQASEDAAIAAAAKACAEKDSGCRLHAIGNFRVAEE